MGTVNASTLITTLNTAAATSGPRSAVRTRASASAPSTRAASAVLATGVRLLDAQSAPNFVGFEAERHRPLHTGQHRDVVELADDAAQAQPVHGVAGAQVDHEQPGPRLDAAAREGVVELEAR